MSYKWLEFSNKVKPKSVFIMAIIVWPFNRKSSGELLYWLAYHGGRKYILNSRKYLPLGFIKSYLSSEINIKKMILPHLVDEAAELEMMEHEWLHDMNNLPYNSYELLARDEAYRA